MKPATSVDKAKLALSIGILALLTAAMIWLALSGHLQRYWREGIDLFENREQLRAYLQSWGPRAPLAFIAIQALQVVISPIPGELTGLLGGFLFGTTLSVVYSMAGLTLGSAAAFLLARIIGQPLVNLAISQKTMEKFRFVTQVRGTVATLVLFLIPGFPKDVLSYLLGMSPMSFLTFLVVCGIGRIPGTIMLGYSGAAVYKESWQSLQIFLVVCAVIAAVLYVKRDRIMTWLHEWHSDEKPQEEKDGSDHQGGLR
jgi:uncharacterized membrane protein YdjX (TVP38/TMEM64 family)